MKPCAVLFFTASPSVTLQSAGWRFQLGSQNSQSQYFISLISNTSKIMASSTTYNISCRDYKLRIFSIKRPKSPRPLIEWSQPIRRGFLLLRAHIVTFFRLAFHGKGWRNYTKAAFFVITETQFAIQSQVT